MLTKAQIRERLGFKTDDEVARLFDISPAAVSQWGDGPIPARRELQLKFELRPGVFGTGQRRSTKRRKAA